MAQQVESYSQEELEMLEAETLQKLKKIRTMRGISNPQPVEQKEVVNATFRRLDSETGQPTSVADDLSSIGFREVLANPKDPAAQVAFLKNLKNRPDVAEKLRDTLTSEEFLEKAAIGLGGAILGFYARGELEKMKRDFFNSEWL